MKYTYEYRTGDNVRHSGVIAASSRDDAFQLLKGQGIKPFSIAEAPGFFNSLFGKGKRWMAIGVLSAVCGVLSVYILNSSLITPRPSLVSSLPRQQIYGDPGILQKCERERWANVFVDAFDLVLVKFAQPGRAVAEVGTCRDANLEPVAVEPDDAAEIAKMKRIVNGMKKELAAYLADGGSVDGYVERLVERQNVERELQKSYEADFESLRQRGASESSRKNVMREWDEKNGILRDMGLRPVRMPDEWGE